MTKTKKTILGLEEEIKIYLPNGKYIKRKAKIDTGARSSAIDVCVAEKIGLGHVYTDFHKLFPKLNITQRNLKTIRQKIKKVIFPKLKIQIPDLCSVDIVPSSNGITVRPYVNFEYKLRNKRIKTTVSIVPRSHLLYLILIGKKDMAGFLIDPTKNDYKVA